MCHQNVLVNKLLNIHLIEPATFDKICFTKLYLDMLRWVELLSLMHMYCRQGSHMVCKNGKKIEITQRPSCEFHITCDLLSWASGRVTNSLSRINNKRVSYSLYHAYRMINCT